MYDDTIGTYMMIHIIITNLSTLKNTVYSVHVLKFEIFCFLKNNKLYTINTVIK